MLPLRGARSVSKGENKSSIHANWDDTRFRHDRSSTRNDSQTGDTGAPETCYYMQQERVYMRH